MLNFLKVEHKLLLINSCRRWLKIPPQCKQEKTCAKHSSSLMGCKVCLHFLSGGKTLPNLRWQAKRNSSSSNLVLLSLGHAESHEECSALKTLGGRCSFEKFLQMCFIEKF